jgi:tetratricopeptide (TPR) repeat protein
MNSKLKAIITVIIIIVILIILFSINILIGLAVLLLFFIYMFYMKRASFFSIIGTLNYSKGKLEKAINWYTRAYKTGRANSRTNVSYAYLLLKSGRIDESETILQKLLSSSINNDDMMFAKSNLALAVWKKGDLDGAVSILEEIMPDYTNSTIYGSLGYFYILKGDFDKALQFNLEAYEYNNTNTVILDNLGQTYHLTGQNEKALEIYKTLVAKNPAFPEAYFNYSLVLEKLGKPELALEMAEKALNYRLTFLSTISRDDIEEKIKEISSSLKTV